MLILHPQSALRGAIAAVDSLPKTFDLVVNKTHQSRLISQSALFLSNEVGLEDRSTSSIYSSI
jgi:hypothetical protein